MLEGNRSGGFAAGRPRRWTTRFRHLPGAQVASCVSGVKPMHRQDPKHVPFRPSCRSSQVSNARIQVDACSALTPSFQCSSWPRLTPKRLLSHVISQSPPRLPHLEARPEFHAVKGQESHSFAPYCLPRSMRHQHEQRSFSRVTYSATSEVLDSGPYGR
jgi:hypothetical protein